MPIEYPQAIEDMEKTVAGIINGRESETVWLLEHPPIYTAGSSAKETDLLDPRFPVFKTGRGGQYTYHGPGQRIAYVMIDLKKRQKSFDIRQYIFNLEEWIITSLSEVGIKSFRREGKTGIWVNENINEKQIYNKIAAIGVRIRRGVTFHGVSINIATDLSHYSGIVPCGIYEDGVTSVNKILSTEHGTDFLDDILRANFICMTADSKNL